MGSEKSLSAPSVSYEVWVERDDTGYRRIITDTTFEHAMARASRFNEEAEENAARELRSNKVRFFAVRATTTFDEISPMSMAERERLLAKIEELRTKIREHGKTMTKHGF